MNSKDKKNPQSSAVDAEDWHPADIVAALHKAGTTMTKLAKSHGLSSGNTLSKAMRSSFPIAEKRIADALGIHPKEIWPSRYYPNGEQRPRGCRAIQFNPSKECVNIKEDTGSEGRSQEVDRRKNVGDRRHPDRRAEQPKDSN